MSSAKTPSQPSSEPRPLAPATTVRDSSLRTPDAALSSSDSGSAVNPSASHTGRINKKNTSMACEACKVSKRKVGSPKNLLDALVGWTFYVTVLTILFYLILSQCDGDLPCSNCSATNKSCQYDPTQDGRRKQGRKRRVDELELRSQVLEKLLHSLKNSSSSNSSQLLDLIRQDASLGEILEFLDSHPGTDLNEARATLSPGPQNDHPRRMLTLTELTDSPTVKVPAAPWTSVTKDDFFVSHLVSAYFSWYHWYYHNFDDKLFVDAMAAGNLDSLWCSPFLVNAILGMGCVSGCQPQDISIGLAKCVGRCSRIIPPSMPHRAILVRAAFISTMKLVGSGSWSLESRRSPTSRVSLS